VAVTASVTPEHVALDVTDDGPGIAPDVLPRIFDKFVKAPDGTKGGQGTGLGLAIAKGIMEAHGGAIAAESPMANGRGTRMTVFFPQGTPA
jgi:two-component system, OmpR family, sensor histidine kinase KdpD